jgi:DNA-binding NtrC family response regulator
MILEDGDLITMRYLPRDLVPEERAASASLSRPAEIEAAGDAEQYVFRLPPKGIILDEVEMSLVRQALERSGGNQTRAAELLGISRDQLRYRLKKLEEAEARG